MRRTVPPVVPVLVGSTGVQTLLAMATLAVATIAPALAPVLGVDPGLVGLQIATLYVTAVTGSLLAGDIVARLGPARTMQLALLCAGAGLALAAWPTLLTLALGSLVIGMGYGLTNPAAAQLLARRVTDNNRNLVFSLKQTGVPAGGALAGLMVPAVTVAVGWQAALLVAAGLCLAAALLLQPVTGRWDRERDASRRIGARPLAALRAVWDEPRLRLLALACLCFSSVQLMLMGYAVTLLVEGWGWPLVQAGSVLAAMQVAGVVGRVLWGGIADRWLGGPATLLVTAGCSALLLFALASLAVAPAALQVAGLVLLGATAIGWNGVYVAEVARIAGPGLAGAATGGAMTIVFVGVLAGPSAYAAVYGWLGDFGLAFRLASVVLLIGAALVVALRRVETRAFTVPHP